MTTAASFLIAWIAGPGLVFAGAVFAGQALAGQNRDLAGSLDATAFAPLPAVGEVALRAPDRSAVSDKLRAAFERELALRGYNVDVTGPLTFAFEWSGAFDSAVGGESPVQLRGEGGSRGQADLGIVLKPPFASASRRRTYTLRATLSDTASRQPIWKGEARAVSGDRDRTMIIRRMVAVLLEHMGRSVAQQAFR